MPAQVYNACWLLLALIPSALWMRAIATDDRGTWRRLLGLCAALGVLGFVFSAVSPDDDNIQQVFTQSQKASAYSVRNGTRGGARIAVSLVFSPRALPAFSHTQVVSVDITRTLAPAFVQIQAATDTSPPFPSFS